MTPGPNAIKLIKEFEGCRLTAYPDPASGGDPWTIGYGATGAGITKGTVWTQAHADARLTSDLCRFAAIISRFITNTNTTQNQFDAMMSFAYNLGAGSLEHSTLLRDHNAGNYDAAKGQFALWDKAGGQVMSGLSRRRTAEASIYGLD